MSSQVHPISIDVSQNAFGNPEDPFIRGDNEPKTPLPDQLQEDDLLEQPNSNENSVSKREAKFVEILQNGGYRTTCEGVEMNEDLEELLLELKNMRTNTSSSTIINCLSRVNAKIDDFFARKATFSRIYIKFSKEILLLILILLPISIVYTVQLTVNVFKGFKSFIMNNRQCKTNWSRFCRANSGAQLSTIPNGFQ